jgi:hypothetical protein
MAAGGVARKPPDNLVAVEISRNMAHGAVGMELNAVPAGDSRRLLPAMLESMEPQSDHGCRRVRAADPENSAFLAQLVVVERIRRKHLKANPFAAAPAACHRFLPAHIEASEAFVALL